MRKRRRWVAVSATLLMVCGGQRVAPSRAEAPPLYREISDHEGVARVYRVSEPQPWRVERSELWEKSGLTKKYFGRIEPRQDYMTAVCGP